MIELKHVTAGYGKEKIIQDVSVKFLKGEITAIVGPNGSGKSTLLKTILGLSKRLEGNICVEGSEIREMGHKELAKKVSYLPQNRMLPAITVYKMVLHGRFPYLGYPRHYRKEDYRHAEEAMKVMGILPLKDKTVAKLSGGERQKVYLAMAIAGETEAFIFDEPTTYLDIRYQLELLELIQKLKEQGKTIIIVLHDLDYALRIADKMVIMKDGMLIKMGIPEDIVKNKVLDEVFHIRTTCFEDSNHEKYYYFK